jgi:hypothetical protein
LLVALAVLLSSPSPALACSCGCGLFDVQAAAMAADAGGDYPVQSGGPPAARRGGYVFLEYDDVDQNQNWRGSRRASADDNEDKRLRTGFFTLGAQYMFGGSWGAMADLPVWTRGFKTVDDDGNLVSFHDTGIADVRLRAVYTGFSEDRSAGITFGLKLPTGDYKAAGFDRDSQIGTGSTDVLLGAYRTGKLTDDGGLTWFGNLLFDQPALTAGGYRPGAELDALLGAMFRGWEAGGARVSPLAQAIFSARGRDTGTLAHPDDTGYGRLLVGPGVHLSAGRFVADAGVGFPVAQNVNGNQLMAARYWRLSAGWRF